MIFIIFDIDGTLADTKKIDDQCFIKAFEQTFKIDIRNQIWEDLKHVTDWGITEEIILQNWGRVPGKDEYELMTSNLVDQLRQEKRRDRTQFVEVSGAREFFYKLKEMKEFKVGIATGAWEPSAKIKLESVGIGLQGIPFSNSSYHKSRESITKDVMNQLTEKSGELPDRIVYFGDGEWDYKTTTKLGIEFMGIDIEGDGKLRALGVKSIWRDFVNADQLIREIKNPK